MDIFWPRKHVEALLYEYMKEPILYRKEHPLYNWKGDKEKAIERVRAKLENLRPGISLHDVKDRYKRMKGSYMSLKKKIRKLAAMGKVYEPTIYYYKIFEEMFGKDPPSIDEAIPLETPELAPIIDEGTHNTAIEHSRTSLFPIQVLEGMVLANQVFNSHLGKNTTVPTTGSNFARSAGDLFTKSLRKLDFKYQLRAVNHMSSLIEELLPRKAQLSSSFSSSARQQPYNPPKDAVPRQDSGKRGSRKSNKTVRKHHSYH